MLLCVHGFLSELVAAEEAGQLPGRDCVNLLEEALALATSPSGEEAWRKHHIDWTTVLPVAALAKVTHARLQNFRDKRLPRWLALLEAAQ